MSANWHLMVMQAASEDVCWVPSSLEDWSSWEGQPPIPVVSDWILGTGVPDTSSLVHGQPVEIKRSGMSRAEEGSAAAGWRRPGLSTTQWRVPVAVAKQMTRPAKIGVSACGVIPAGDGT